MQLILLKNKIFIFALLATSNLSTFSNKIPKIELLKSTIRWTPHAILAAASLFDWTRKGIDYFHGPIAVGKQGRKAQPPADMKKLRDDFISSGYKICLSGFFMGTQAAHPGQKIPGMACTLYCLYNIYKNRQDLYPGSTVSDIDLIKTCSWASLFCFSLYATHLA